MSESLRGDDGTGLIELLFAIVLLGIGVVAILSAMATMVRTSALHRDQARATDALTIAAEGISATSVAYQSCAAVNLTTYTTAKDNALAAAGVTSGVTISNVAYWNGTGFDSTTCYDADPNVDNANKIQRILLSASVPRQATPFTLEIVKRAQ